MTKIHYLKITGRQANDLLELINSGCSVDRSLVYQLQQISEKDSNTVTNKGRDSEDDTKKVSKNHSVILDIHSKCFPTNKITQSLRFQCYVNGTRTNLEIDIVDKTLNLAIEVNGSQHYKFNKFFHSSQQDFHKQVSRDDAKRSWCEENNITLVIVDEKLIKEIESKIKTDEQYSQRIWLQHIKSFMENK